jgi:hypothetical protein
MKNIFITIILSSSFVCNSFGQNATVSFKSSDAAIELAFNRAKTMALSYKGNSTDPVGPWYEAALPARSAFCMRDVAHQSIGAEILGLKKENKNMLSHFAKNISESKDWCSYWEINKYGKPAPEDYRNDKEFWYNLGSNFDIMFACWRLYLWTGDESYIKSPEFKNFFEKSATKYIDRWVLDVDSLLTRPEFPNASTAFNTKDAFHNSRGLPSYSEGIPNLIMGVDLVAAIYRGLMTYSSVLRLNGDVEKAEFYEKKAEKYQQQIEKIWWDDTASTYNVIYTGDGKFSTDPSELFLLWFDALKDTSRTRKMIEHIISEKANVESSSYLPFLLYKYGFGDKGYDYIMHLTDPATKRRDYPEVSYGVIEGIVHGYMGIEPDGTENTVATLYRGKTGVLSEVDNLPVLNTVLSVKQESQKTTFQNKGKVSIQWRAMFSGNYKTVYINNKKMVANHKKDDNGNTLTFVDVSVNSGQQLNAVCK